MTAGFRAATLLSALAAGFGALAFATNRRDAPDTRRTLVMRAVAESVGLNTLALTSAGGAFRHPTEGFAGGLGDQPAGYGVWSAGDVTTCPGVAAAGVFEATEAAP